MKKIELLSPAGDFECLKAAIQNGADSVYLGSSSFSARANATNFNFEELKNAIEYAHLRDVKINLTLNTLIKNNEFDEAVEIAKKAYEFGVDAIIVQDLGLSKLLNETFPDIVLHASTQMTAHNLETVKYLEKIGFKRFVVSRELSIDEIKNICKNTNVEIEVFIHGALCISYSGQCLFSSMIGGRSGNRGTCAQACRLPYELLEENKVIDKGYLLSPRDLCSLEYLKELVDSGVKCFKIEGRMKKPEYVATVTSVYRKYIDKILEENKDFSIDSSDLNNLMQVFNRGSFSTGHLSTKENLNLIFKEKPNNMGIYIGKVFDINESKGYVKLELENSLSLGDSVSIGNCIYRVSELMENNKNTKTALSGAKVTIGRMKGDNIRKNSNIYKIESKALTDEAIKSFSSENKKIPLEAFIKIKKGEKISLLVKTLVDKTSFYYGLESFIESDIIPEESINSPITKERIISQISKTGNTEFEFKNINVDLDDNLHIPNISILNELRRNSLSLLENKVIKLNVNTLSTEFKNKYLDDFLENSLNLENKKYDISLLLNILDKNIDYSNLLINRLYIPLKYFLDSNYAQFINNLCKTYDVFVYFPIISKDTYLSLIKNNLNNILNFKISGFVVSNLGQYEIVKNLNLKIVANYSFNIFNNYSEKALEEYNFDKFTISPELDKQGILSLLNNKIMKSEQIIYGKIPLMNMNYCLLGNSNKCYKDCKKKCLNNNKYYLKDRMNFTFRVLPDNSQTITTIYNSKTLSLTPTDFNSDSFRIDILDENIDDIKNIIDVISSGNRLEGNEYTNR